MALPFPDNSVESLSCMHVMEHVGLGRYGDTVDARGDLRAAGELSRVLKKGGQLLMVLPMNEIPRVVFNAHRLYSYKQVLEMFPSLTVREFSLVPPGNVAIVKNAQVSDIANAMGHIDSTGMFWFEKK